VSTGRVRGLCPRPVNTDVENETRVQKPWTRALFLTPVFVGRGHALYPRPVDTGSVYRTKPKGRKQSRVGRL